MCENIFLRRAKFRFGFYVPNPKELETVEWIMRTFLKYGSQQKTIEECSKRSIKNKNGKEFKKHSLTTLLTNKKYIGKWEANLKNKNKNQQKLLPYEKYKEIELPHGCVIDLSLWNSVQSTLAQTAGNKTKNTRLTRIYTLSGILRSIDGTPFHGRSAHGSNGTRNNYYYNQNVKHPFRADDLEAETKKVVAAIVKDSDQVQDAVRQHFKDVKSLTDLIKSQAEQVAVEIANLETDKAALDFRLDFLLTDGTIEEAKEFKVEYKKRAMELCQQINQKKASLDLMAAQNKDLKDDSFDWRSVKDRAGEILDLIHEHDPVALKRAYSQLFEAIEVGELDEGGKRPLRFILRDAGDCSSKEKKPVVNGAESLCDDTKMAQEEGLEPPTKRLTAACSTTELLLNNG